MNDDDLDMARLTDAGNTIARLAKRGICAHGWTGPYIDGQPKADPRRKCYHCGHVFADADEEAGAWDAFRDRYL